jgi:lipopolysaccharide biosynthesis protein
MSKLLTVLHVFYHEQVDYFIDKLSNINGIDWDLVVTYSTYSAETEAKLRDFKSDVKIVQVGNAGYDVWPFIQVIQNVDFSEYDYVLKLHTKGQSKQRLNGVNFKEWLWRDLLVKALLKSRSRFAACIRLLETQSDIGMLCSYELYKDMEGVLPEECEMLQNEAERISLEVTDEYFCAGTIFLARLDAFRKLKEIEFSEESWGNLNKSHGNGTLAHVYERILCLLVADEGYRIETIIGSKKVSGKVFYKRKISPVFKSIFNIDRDPKTLDKYMILLGLKMRLSQGRTEDKKES